MKKIAIKHYLITNCLFNPGKVKYHLIYFWIFHFSSKKLHQSRSPSGIEKCVRRAPSKEYLCSIVVADIPGLKIGSPQISATECYTNTS